MIGLLETHGRLETAALAEGLELVPRRTLVYRATEMTEMDLPAILTRAPQLCLIDELAHTNAPGVEHAKRYEDVEVVLEAGIDVFSTLNVQHLESLNDTLAEHSGVRVRETLPDQTLQKADEVVLVDVTPEALLGRLREGRVYPVERIDTALNGFFRIENLTALREAALRQVADEVVAAPREQVPRHRPSASGYWRWSSRSRARSVWFAAPGARPSASAPSSTCCGCSRPGGRRPTNVRALWRRCGSSRRCSAPT